MSDPVVKAAGVSGTTLLLLAAAYVWWTGEEKKRAERARAAELVRLQAARASATQTEAVARGAAAVVTVGGEVIGSWYDEEYGTGDDASENFWNDWGF